MGAWGEDPMANDTALDWLSSQIETPVAVSIHTAFRSYLDGAGNPAEAEAAAALLIEYTAPSQATKYRGIDLTQAAVELDLWRIGREVIERLLADEAWIDTWLDPGTKREVLRGLLTEMEQPEAVSE
jgi:hypothetical protein